MKTIQIAIGTLDNGNTVVVALRDDGSIWSFSKEWEKFPDIPQLGSVAPPEATSLPPKVGQTT